MTFRRVSIVTVCLTLIAAAVSAQAQTIAAGAAHTVVRTPDGTVWTFGSNSFGQLGDGSTTQRTTPVHLTTVAGITAVAAGADHTLALQSDGTVWAWGRNHQGQLGDNTTTTRTAPVIVAGLPPITAIAAGAAHSVALASNGTIWTWGLNGNGQLGIGTTTRSLQPVLVATAWTATGIAAGQSHTLAIQTDGTLWGWGANASGQLGAATPTQSTLPVAIGGVAGAIAVAGGNCHTAVLRNDGRVLASGCNSAGELGNNGNTGRAAMDLVPSLTNVAGIAAGYSFTSALTSGGEVWSWGGNLYGQIGNGSNTTQRVPVRTTISGVVTRIGAGHTHGLAVTTTGIVWTWGANGNGQLGDGTTANRNTPVAISEADYLWKVATPTLSLASGTYNTDRTVVVATATQGAELHYTINGGDPTTADPVVASGGSLPVDATMTLKVRAWKDGLAPSTVVIATYTMTVATPTVTPGAGTYSTPQTVSISTTTPNAELRYTIDGSAPTTLSPLYTTPLQISTTTTLRVIGFRAGWTNSGLRVAAYQMSFGTLAAPAFDPPPGTYTSSALVTLSSIPGATIRYTTNGNNVTTLSAVYAAPIEVTVGLTIKAVAYHPDYTTSPQAAGQYTIAVAAPTLSPGSGEYPAGQVITVQSATPGAVLHYTLDGSTPTTNDPVVPAAGISAGAFVLKVGAWKTGAVPSAIVTGTYAVSGPVSARRLVAGESHTFASRGDGAVWSWGLNGNGQLGDGTTTRRTIPGVVSGLSGVTQLSAGGSHSAALRNDGTLFTWGSNLFGQLGFSGTANRLRPVQVTGVSGITTIAAGKHHTLAVRSGGTVWAWGLNGNGQVGDGTTTNRNSPVQIVTLQDAVGVQAGHLSSFALLADGTLWSWGLNSSGQLGLGDTTSRSTPVQIAGLGGVASVSTGGFHVLARMNDGSVRAWGSNGSGQLGDGSTTQRAAPVTIAALSGVAALAAGESHSLALKEDGSVWSWGGNAYGQLGNGTTTGRVTPGQVAGLPPIASIAAGANDSFALGIDGSVWAWGRNNEGQLGDGTMTNRSTPVRVAGPDMQWSLPTPSLSLAPGTYTGEQTVTVTNVDPDVVMHYTMSGADPTEADPIVASGAALAITQNLTLKVRGWKAGAVTALAQAAYAVRPAAPTISPGTGQYSSVQTVTLSTATPGAAVRYTTDGSLPNGSSTLYASPISVSTSSTVRAIAVRSGWTDSPVSSATYSMNFGTLAPPTVSPAPGAYSGSVTVTLSALAGATIRYTTNNTTPTAFSPAYTTPLIVNTTTTIRAKAFHIDYTASPETIAIYTMGLTAPVLSVPSGGHAPGTRVTITHVDAAATIRISVNGEDPTGTHPSVPSGTSLLVGDFTLKARAFKSGFQDSTVTSATYTLTSAISQGVAAAGRAHTIIAAPGGRLFAWGENFSGQLGDSTTDIRDTPVPIHTLAGVTALALGDTHSVAATADGKLYAWGSYSGDGTTNSRRTPYEVPNISGVIAVAAGANHSLAVTSSGAVYAWGTNGDGQLGLGSTANQYVPTVIPGLTNVVAVAAGTAHSLAVTTTGAVYAWGRNVSGQLGDGTTASTSTPVLVNGLTGIVDVAAGGYHSLARTASGDVFAWGYGLNGQLGLGDALGRNDPQQIPGLEARAIAAGRLHSLALRSDGVMVAWGYNASGQLGNAATANSSSTPIAVAGPAGIAAIAAGDDHSVAVTAAGGVWTWGAGDRGALGSGTWDNDPNPQLVLQAGGRWGGTEPPSFSIPSGRYYDVQTVAVSSTIPDVVLRYTLSGSVPTETDPQIVSGGSILIDQSSTLRVRAWPVGGAPSLVASATYVLQTTMPIVTPATGTYTGSQTVTLENPTGGTTLRYTVDGSEPGEASPIYAAPFNVTTSTTVKARVFRTGWSPSDTAAAVITIVAGVLETPVATPPGGSYAAPQTVSLTGPPGAQVRYTTDGSDPTAASALFTTPIDVAFGVTTVKARAFQSGWAPSAALAATYNVALATVTVQVFLADEAAPGGQGAPAGGGVKISINDRSVGETGPDGTLTVQTPAGELTVAAIVPGMAQASGTITTVPGDTATVSLILDDSGGVHVPATLVLLEAEESIVPRPSPTFSLQFHTDGTPVAMTDVESVVVLDREDRFAYQVTQLFTVSNGRIVAVDAASIYDWLPYGELITLEVHAVDEAGLPYSGIVRFHAGMFRLALDVTAPPSNPGLSTSNIPVRIHVIGSDIVLQRVTDGSGRIDIPWMPYATLKLAADVEAQGFFYYGRATMVQDADRSGVLVLRHVSDVINAVPPLTLDPLPTESGGGGAGGQALMTSTTSTTTATAAGGKKQFDAAMARLRNERADAATRALPPQARVPWRRTLTASTASAPEDTVELEVTSAGADETVANSATLSVPQGTKKVTLKYTIASAEYPQWVQEQSPFDDVWSLMVFAGGGGRQLTEAGSNVNAQLAGNPAWQGDATTGEIQEDFDVEAMTEQSAVELTVYATSVNVRDHLFATTVSAQLGAQKTLVITSAEKDPVSPIAPKGVHTYFSIPRLGEKNVDDRWFKLKVTKPDDATVSKVRLRILSESGSQLLQRELPIQAGTTNPDLRVQNDGEDIEVRVTFHSITSSIPGTPPTTHGLRYEFIVEGTQNGQAIASEKKEVADLNALWRMPSQFDGRRYSIRKPGHDDWASKETYEWLAANSSSITRINHISGEHAKNIGHNSHTRGTDIDTFHYHTIPGMRNTGRGEGIDNYHRLVAAVAEAHRGNPDGLLQVENWILATRAGFDALLATNKIRILIYAKGSADTAQSLTRGWAESLLKTGKITIGTETFDTRMGTWRQTESRILYQTDHNDHVHISLSVK